MTQEHKALGISIRKGGSKMSAIAKHHFIVSSILRVYGHVVY